MAIYHLTAKTGSRSKGQSARAKSDYITRSGKYAKDSDEVVFSRSGNMPVWVVDPSDYWRAADTYERSNGRLYKEIEFALPRELSSDQQRELAETFARHLTGKENLPFTMAIHAGKGENPHVHLMINERINDGLDRSSEIWFKRHDRKKPGQTGAKKTDQLKPKKWLELVRKDWAELANFALERAGLNERIDHRSLTDQGIGRVPQIHIGQGAMAMERQGLVTDRGAEALEIEEINREHERIKRAAEQSAECRPDQGSEPASGRGKKTAPENSKSKRKPQFAAEKKSSVQLSIIGRLRAAFGWLLGDRDRVLAEPDPESKRPDHASLSDDQRRMLEEFRQRRRDIESGRLANRRASDLAKQMDSGGGKKSRYQEELDQVTTRRKSPSPSRSLER